MKLLTLQLNTAFNSLQPFARQEFVYFPEKKNILEPICLIGANGSGKSNMLEFITEVFFYIENEVRFEQKGTRKIDREFIIEYFLFNAKGNETRVKIDSGGDSKWKMYVQKKDKWQEISDDYKLVQQHLPEKIVGYTSGMNETLSFRFAQLNGEYATIVREAGINNPKTKIPDNRLIFIDYDANAAILIANYLLKSKEDLHLFEETIRVTGLTYFKLVLDFELSSKKYVQLTDEHRTIIQRFKSCSTTFNIISEEKDEGIEYHFCEFDFVVNEATKKAFKFNFKDAYTLFMSFQKLSLLNDLKLKRKYRYISGKGIDQMPPKVGFEERVFRFTDIQLKIHSPERVIPYIGISDGEHQFIEVIGSIMLFSQRNVLFLYDEPETHFNPQWRSKLISIIHEKTKNRLQELILTTHSPFIVSDCKGYNVYKFWRDKEAVWFAPIGIETYGTSITIILKEVFDKNILISELAREDIEQTLKSDNLATLQDKYDELGESRDRDLLLEKMNRILLEKNKD